MEDDSFLCVFFFINVCCYSTITTLWTSWWWGPVSSWRCSSYTGCGRLAGSSRALLPLSSAVCRSPRICSTRRGRTCPWPQSWLSRLCQSLAWWAYCTHSTEGQTSHGSTLCSVSGWWRLQWRVYHLGRYHTPHRWSTPGGRACLWLLAAYL